MELNFIVIIAYITGIILLFVLGRLLIIPLKVVFKLVYNGFLGALALIAVNFIGGYAGYHLALNITTAFVTGLLGIPGLLLLIVLKLIFNIA